MRAVRDEQFHAISAYADRIRRERHQREAGFHPSLGAAHRHSRSFVEHQPSYGIERRQDWRGSGHNYKSLEMILDWGCRIGWAVACIVVGMISYYFVLAITR